MVAGQSGKKLLWALPDETPTQMRSDDQIETLHNLYTPPMTRGRLRCTASRPADGQLQCREHDGPVMAESDLGAVCLSIPYSKPEPVFRSVDQAGSGADHQSGACSRLQ